MYFSHVPSILSPYSATLCLPLRTTALSSPLLQHLLVAVVWGVGQGQDGYSDFLHDPGIGTLNETLTGIGMSILIYRRFRQMALTWPLCVLRSEIIVLQPIYLLVISIWFDRGKVGVFCCRGSKVLCYGQT